MLVACSPSKRVEIARQPLLAVEEVSSNPSLTSLQSMYGEKATMQMVRIQVIKTFERCGFNLPDDDNYKIELFDWISEQIMASFPNLKVRELMLFMNDFEKGDFGDFFCRFNSQQFFIALKSWFSNKRITLMERLQKTIKEENDRLNADKRITYEEYLKLKQQEEN